MAVTGRSTRSPGLTCIAGKKEDSQSYIKATLSRGICRGFFMFDLSEVRALLIDNEPTSDTSLAEDRDTLGRLTRCRSVDEAQGWSKAVPEGAARAWHEAWSEHRHRYGVVYGHWSMQGLHVAEGLRGLDTGCVHHGRGRDGYLTAWLPTAGDAEENDVSAVDPFDLPDDRFWQIPALARYYD